MKKKLLFASTPFLVLTAIATATAVFQPKGPALSFALAAIVILAAIAVLVFRRLVFKAIDDVLIANAELEAKVRTRRDELEVSENRRTRINAFLDSIIENIPDMIFVKDAKELRFVLFNKAGEELLGYSRQELIGKNDYDFFPKTEADFFTAKDRQVLNRGKVVVIDEESIHTKNGIRTLHTKKIPLLDRDGVPQYLLGISEDITARKLFETNLTQRTQELAQAKVEKEQTELFAYVAAHDLREPAHKICSFGDLLTEYLPAEGPAREYLSRMQSAASRMGRLIDDLLRFSKITKGEMRTETVLLDAVVRDVLQDFDLTISEAGARVDVDTLPTVKGGHIELQEVFRNLIGNAIKFRAVGRAPVIRITAGVEPGGCVTVTVADNGIGFDQVYAERIFRPFERLHSRREYDGSGIGLAICEKLVDHMGARINASSKPGEGASFTIIFPATALEKSEPMETVEVGA